MKRMIFSAITILAIICASSLYSCHRGGNSGTPATGTVALFLTDDPMELFTQVTATINRIQLVSTGTGTACDVLTAPATVNIANLADVMQLVNVAECPAGPFNRIHIEFDKSVQLMSGPTGTGMPSLCSFVSFKDEGSGSQPNILQCDVDNICRLDVNGAVNVLVQQDNRLALDFNLKDFEVMHFGEPMTCGVTMKVSPLNASDIEKRGNREAITGIVSRLSTTDRTFNLTRGNRTFAVLYSGITDTGQPGLDVLLQRAQDDGLRTKVTASNIDFMNNTISASEILVKVEGTVSNLVSGSTFSVKYGPGGSRNIGVDHSNAAVEGTPATGSWVDVKLYGSTDVSNTFLARKVEVESPGTMTED